MAETRARHAVACVFAAVLVAMFVSACTPKPPEWEPATTKGPTRVEIFRGVLSEPQPGRLTLMPCRVNMHVDVRDQTGGDLEAARAALGSGPGRDIFVELRVERGVRMDDWRTPEDRVLVALELLRAMPIGEGDACASMLRVGEARASGNEPFWSVTISPEGIAWTEPDLPAPLAFPAATAVHGEDGSVTWTSTREGETRKQLRIVVTPGRCFDGMSGAWYPSTAQITLGDRVLHGCAYDGG